MFTLLRRKPRPRPACSLRLRPLLVATTLAFGACDGAENPLAPGADQVTPSSEPTPGEALAPAGTPALVGWQRILFTSTRTGGYDLYKTDPSGANVVRFTKYTDYETEAAWSYDNQRIAMLRPRRDASNVVHPDVFLINADGSNGRWARSTPLSYDLRSPSWSPDGSRILVSIKQVGKYYIGRMNAATGQVSFVTSGGAGVQGNYASFDPTGKKIVYVGPTGLTVDQINPDGTGHKVLYTGTTGVSGPKISPDGKKLVFAKVFGSNIDLCVVNLVDGTRTRVTTDPAIDVSPTWSPDGSRIAFASTRSGKSQIYSTDPKGGNLKRITNTATDEKDPAWSH
jgi:Tol biopolymer transport system component